MEDSPLLKEMRMMIRQELESISVRLLSIEAKIESVSGSTGQLKVEKARVLAIAARNGMAVTDVKVE